MIAAPARSAACPAPTRAWGRPAAPRRASPARRPATAPAHCRRACRRSGARVRGVRGHGGRLPHADIGAPPLARRWHCCKRSQQCRPRLWYGAAWRGAMRRVERRDGDCDRAAAQTRCAAGARPARRRGDRLPRMRHACTACRAMPDDTIARCTACGAKIFIRFERVGRRARWRSTSRRSGPVPGRQRLPDHDHVDRGPDATRPRSWTAPRRSTTTGMWPSGASPWPWPACVLPLAKILGMLAILLPLQLGLRPRLDRRRLPLGRAAAALGDDGGLPAGRDRGLREAAGPRRPSISALPLVAFVGTILLMAAADAALRRRTRSGAGSRRRPGPRCCGRGPARRCSPASTATRWCGCRRRRICTASPARAAARRSAPPQARQPEPHLGAGAHRRHPLHPGQPAAGA